MYNKNNTARNNRIGSNWGLNGSLNSHWGIAVEVNGTNPTPENMTISGNNITGKLAAGIYLNGGKNHLVSGNFLSSVDTMTYSIVSNYSDSVNISGNRVTDAYLYACRLKELFTTRSAVIFLKLQMSIQMPLLYT